MATGWYISIWAGNPDKYKQKPVLGFAAVGRYKKSLYFSLPGFHGLSIPKKPQL